MSRSNNFPLQLLLLYSLFIIYATTIPFAFDTPTEKLPGKFSALCADPLQLRTLRGFSLTDVVSNVLLFLPFGFLVALASAKTASAVQRSNALVLALGASLVLSFLVEFMQFFEEQRVASVLDCITNTAGAGCGVLLAWHYQQRHRDYAQRYLLLQFAHNPRLQFFLCYALLLALTQLLPLQLTLDISTLKKNLKATEWALPKTATALGDLFADTILYAGFAWLWLYAQKQTRRTRSMVQAIFLTLGAATLLECAQFFLVAHALKLRNVLAGLEGGLYGAAWYLFVNHHAARRTRAARDNFKQNAMRRLALAHLLAYIFLLELQPYHFNFSAAHVHAKFAQFHWLPFLEYYQSTNAHAFLDLGAGLVRYALLVRLLQACWPALNAAARNATLLALALGVSVCLECLQLGLPRHAPGITDCVNALWGAALGIWFSQKRAPRFQIAARRAPAPAKRASSASTYFRPIPRER